MHFQQILEIDPLYKILWCVHCESYSVVVQRILANCVIKYTSKTQNILHLLLKWLYSVTELTVFLKAEATQPGNQSHEKRNRKLIVCLFISLVDKTILNKVMTHLKYGLSDKCHNCPDVYWSLCDKINRTSCKKNKRTKETTASKTACVMVCWETL